MTITAANISASDMYQFFQAKNIRQTDNQLAADELQTLMLPPEPLHSRLEQRLAGYRANVARYESEPATRDGKRELLERAAVFDADRDHAPVKAHSLHYSESLLQISIVLGSVSILALSRRVLKLSSVLAATAVVLMLNRLFVGVHLPV